MNTTPEQLELAADILRHKRPFQYRHLRETWSDCKDPHAIVDLLHSGCEIQLKPLSFPPKPEGMEWHLHDELTPELCGPDHRPFVKGESADQPHEVYIPGKKRWGNATRSPSDIDIHNSAYRLPISTPYPDGSYVKDGKLVKPWKLTREIPGFRPLRENEEWHFTSDEWKEGDLGDGERPVLRGEQYRKGDFRWCGGFGPWTEVSEDGDHDGLVAGNTRFKTRRPLPEPAPEPKPVALGAEDVPPGSAIRPESEMEGRYHLVTNVDKRGVFYPLTTGIKFMSFQELMEIGATIHRPGNLDPSGKPIFVPCSKLP